jgi:ABC-2 type transport system ATP-binding protein
MSGVAPNVLNSEFVIEARALSKSYRTGLIRRQFHHALQHVDLKVHRGEVFGLLGPNGAGKTTLIKILLGIIHPTSGEASVLSERAGSRSARQRIGYLPENLVFPRHHTGEGALYFYGRLSGLSESTIRNQIPPLIELVGLTGRQREPVRKYSKGMRQRLGLAQALLHDPEILVLDEPTDGLDPLGRSQIRELIERLREQGKSVFLNSHILQEVELVCDRVAIMARGQVRAIGSIEELIDRHSPTQTIDVWIDVAGDDATCRSLFVGPDVQSVEQLETRKHSAERVDELLMHATQEDVGSRYRVRLSVDQQSKSDAWIDRVRTAGLSLLGLQRQKPRLEDIFVQLVENLDKKN